MKPFMFGAAMAVCCVLIGITGCRKKRLETPAAPVPSTVAAPSAEAPATAQPKIGETMPPVTTEMMLKFESRFGRPPTNYSELSRLKN
jgi:hypothetical protein